jgi:hypothetical protein
VGNLQVFDSVNSARITGAHPKSLGLFTARPQATSNLQSNTLQDSLHPILKKLGHVKSGFNIFRRFRITHLQTEGCPEALRHFWSGHEPTHVEERYTKLLEKREYRLNWAERLGLGFELNLGRLGRPKTSNFVGWLEVL